MPFGTDLNNQFAAETARITGTVNEQKLFEALDRSFSNLAATSPTKCKVIHGARNLVKFSEKSPSQQFYYAKDRGKAVKCELADLLLITVDDKEMRICCLQNKFEKKKTSGMAITDSFKADMRQFYLLNVRPLYERKGITSNLLKDAICPSVGSYGVFYSNSGAYNMNYHSAEILSKVNPATTGRACKVHMNPAVPQLAYYPTPTGTVSEWRYTGNILEFGNGLECMQIGTPFLLSSGILAIGDSEILDAITSLTDMNEDLSRELRATLSTATPSVSYRTAVVIKGNR